MKKYICKIPSLEEMNIKWDYEIEHANDDRNNWIVWKNENIERYKKKYIIPYYGLLDGIIISECTAAINSIAVQNSDGLVDGETAYLTAFRTIDEYQNQGYFSILFNYMIEDLKNRGYKRVTLGVEPSELKNKAIYTKYGFTNYIKTASESYPDGTKVEVEYYSKSI
ncbi:MAG: GNAT family N-acetyltransferase [Bacilli bacterium]|nr:GNAT family N-acetyltransferase [Bacilli bacterium]